jgi:hypothetical protein
MSQHVVVTGPCSAWVSTANEQFALLGTCQIRPRILWRRQFEPVFADIGGNVPFDMMYAGMEAVVFLDLTRYDPEILDACRALPSLSKEKLGKEVLGDIGTMMMLEDKAGNLTLSFPYSIITSNGELRHGLHFPAAFILSPDMEEDGTRHSIQRVAFYCMRSFDPESMEFTLFDTDVTANLQEGGPEPDEQEFALPDLPAAIRPPAVPNRQFGFTIIGPNGAQQVTIDEKGALAVESKGGVVTGGSFAPRRF